MRLVHELEQFVDNSLQESPVCSQETGILADDVHNVGRDYCLIKINKSEKEQKKGNLDLVVLALLLFT